VTGYSAGNTVDAATYYELKAFYAGHMALRDRGETEGWLDAFDDDAVMVTNVLDESMFMSKAAFAPAVHNLDIRFAAAGIQRRHVLNTFAFARNEDGTVSTTDYAMLVTTSPEGICQLHSTAVSRDVLTRTATGWRVLFREVLRDDLAQLASTDNHVVRRILEGESPMTEVVASTERLHFAEIYCQVEQFYASQMRMLDEGDAAAWTATFTENTVFTSDGMPDQIVGRAALEVAATQSISRLTANGVTRRHLVSNICLEQVSADVLQVTSYVPVIDTAGHQSRITTSAVLQDTLTRYGGTWLVSHRMIMHDDLRAQPPPSTRSTGGLHET
jgi:actinorhodin biosynthesis protein ActVIA